MLQPNAEQVEGRDKLREESSTLRELFISGWHTAVGRGSTILDSKFKVKGKSYDMQRLSSEFFKQTPHTHRMQSDARAAVAADFFFRLRLDWDGAGGGGAELSASS